MLYESYLERVTFKIWQVCPLFELYDVKISVFPSNFFSRSFPFVRFPGFQHFPSISRVYLCNQGNLFPERRGLKWPCLEVISSLTSYADPGNYLAISVFGSPSQSKAGSLGCRAESFCCREKLFFRSDQQV